LTDELLSLRVSTAAYSDKDRLEAFRENFGKAILRVDMEPLGGSALEADMTLSALPGFGMASGSISPVRNRHGSELIDNDDVVIVFLDSGEATLERSGHVVDVRAGDAVITENDQAAIFSGHTETRTTNLRKSRK
jgi:hypothetical protein